MSVLKLRCDEEKKFCWNGDEDALKECIERSKFVKTVRKKLIQKRYNKLFS